MNDGKRITRRRWTAAEDQVIRDRYGELAAAELGLLINRTENAVWDRARLLGADKRDVPPPWTDAELQEVRRCYASEAPASIARRLGRTTSAVSQQAAVLGLLSRKALTIQAVNHEYFASVTTAEQAYIIGLLAADGNIASEHPRVTFGQQAKDACLVELIRDRLSPLAGLSRTPDGYTSVQVTSRQMAADLARFGIVPRKSRVLRWPTCLNELQRPFLLGYFDGDGSMFVPHRHDGQRYPGWTVCSGSEPFLIALKAYILLSAGVELQKIQHRKGADLWQVAVTGKGAYVLDEWLHQDGLGLARKRPPAWAVSQYQVI